LANIKEIDLFDRSSISAEFSEIVEGYRVEIEKAYESFEIHDAIRLIGELVSLGNQHIHEKEPWKQKPELAKITLNNVSALVQMATEFYEPVIPDGAQKAMEALRKKERIILYTRI
jgi:methionyl-tRNA synthetase